MKSFFRLLNPKNFYALCCAFKKIVLEDRNKRKKFITVCCAVLLCAATAVTIAISKDITDETQNKFAVPQPNDEVVEEFPDKEEKTSIKVKNGGEYDEYIRVALVYNWKNSDGEVLGETIPSSYYTGSFNTTDWIKIDNYYYCKAVVKSGETSPELLGATGIKLTATGKANIPAGYQFSVDVITQNIQCKPTSVVKDAWRVSLDAHNEITGGSN